MIYRSAVRRAAFRGTQRAKFFGYPAVTAVWELGVHLPTSGFDVVDDVLYPDWRSGASSAGLYVTSSPAGTAIVYMIGVLVHRISDR